MVVPSSINRLFSSTDSSISPLTPKSPASEDQQSGRLFDECTTSVSSHSVGEVTSMSTSPTPPSSISAHNVLTNAIPSNNTPPRVSTRTSSLYNDNNNNINGCSNSTTVPTPAAQTANNANALTSELKTRLAYVLKREF